MGMGNETTKLSRTNPAVKTILARSFPNYKGRKITARKSPTVYIENVWGGGSRSYAVAIDLRTFEVASMPQMVGDIVLPVYVAMVEHSHFCGKDSGIQITVHPDAGLALGAQAVALLGEGS